MAPPYNFFLCGVDVLCGAFFVIFVFFYLQTPDLKSGANQIAALRLRSGRVGFWSAEGGFRCAQGWYSNPGAPGLIGLLAICIFLWWSFYCCGFDRALALPARQTDGGFSTFIGLIFAEQKGVLCGVRRFVCI